MSWKKKGSISTAAWANGELLAANGFLYLIGGVKTAAADAYLGSILGAKVMDDGQLGPWFVAADIGAIYDLPVTATNGKFIVIAGGWDNIAGGSGNSNNNLAVLRILEDGTLKLVQKDFAPIVTSLGAMVIENGFIYIVGGFNGTTSVGQSQVWSARIAQDGSIDGWKQIGTLPTAVFGHDVFAAGGYLYTVGGKDLVTTTLIPIQRAPIQAGGLLGPWQTIGNSDHSLRTRACAACSHDKKVYMVAGVTYGGASINTACRVELDGTHVGGVKDIDPPPFDVLGHGTALVGQRLYLIGGFDNDTFGAITDVWCLDVV